MHRKTNRAAVSVLLISLLAGCATATKSVPTQSATPTPTAAMVIPTDCEKTGMLSALNAIVPDSLYIKTTWQPAAGTELADFLNNGGVACSYGLQSQEIGITTQWVSDAKGLFENRVAGWMAEGFKKIDIPDLDESEAYFQIKKQSPTQEFHVWRVNMKYHGAWIQLSCTAFAQDLATGYPLLKAATI